jgi:anti-sigma factor RsiW
MDHQEVIRLAAVENYLLDELPPPQRHEFEEHFFECGLCAKDLRMTAEFLDLTREELRHGPIGGSVPRAVKPSWLELLWRPMVIAPALAVLLAVIAYQNVVVYPRLGGAIAQLSRPHIVSAVSLIGANSRGGALPAANAATSQPVLLSVDIPAAEQFPGYACVLVDSSGAIVWRVPVSQEQARDTVSIAVPAGSLRPGDYTLVVQGLSSQGPSKGGAAARTTDVARYRFTLNSPVNSP